MREGPTAAKLVAAILFAFIGMAAALAYEPFLPESKREPLFAEATALIGAFVGWWVMGRLVGGSYRLSGRAGVVTSFWLLFWALLIFSLRMMVLKSWEKRYREPAEALSDVVFIGYGYLKLAMNLPVLGVLAVGGLIAGMVVEFIARRWR